MLGFFMGTNRIQLIKDWVGDRNLSDPIDHFDHSYYATDKKISDRTSLIDYHLEKLNKREAYNEGIHSLIFLKDWINSKNGLNCDFENSEKNRIHWIDAVLGKSTSINMSSIFPLLSDESLRNSKEKISQYAASIKEHPLNAIQVNFLVDLSKEIMSRGESLEALNLFVDNYRQHKSNEATTLSRLIESDKFAVLDIYASNGGDFYALTPSSYVSELQQILRPYDDGELLLQASIPARILGEATVINQLNTHILYEGMLKHLIMNGLDMDAVHAVHPDGQTYTLTECVNAAREYNPQVFDFNTVYQAKQNHLAALNVLNEITPAKPGPCPN